MKQRTKFGNDRTWSWFAVQLRRSHFAPFRQFPEEDGEVIRTSKCRISVNSPPFLLRNVPLESYAGGLPFHAKIMKFKIYLTGTLVKYTKLSPNLQISILQFSSSPNLIPNWDSLSYICPKRMYRLKPLDLSQGGSWKLKLALTESHIEFVIFKVHMSAIPWAK